MKAADLAAVVSVLVTLAGVLLVFGIGWTLIIGGNLALALVIAWRLLALRSKTDA